MKQKRAPYRKEAKPTYTAREVEGWLTHQRDNKLSINGLAKHLGIGYPTAQTYIEKYYAGQLK